MVTWYNCYMVNNNNNDNVKFLLLWFSFLIWIRGLTSFGCLYFFFLLLYTFGFFFLLFSLFFLFFIFCFLIKMYILLEYYWIKEKQKSFIIMCKAWEGGGGNCPTFPQEKLSLWIQLNESRKNPGSTQIVHKIDNNELLQVLLSSQCLAGHTITSRQSLP